MAEQETAAPTRQQTPTPTSTPSQAPTSGGVSSPRVQLKRGVQMMGFAEQAALLAPTAPVQRKGGENTDQVHQAAAAGIASGGGDMPHGGEIQKAFGAHDISGIQAHQGGQAAAANKAMGAEAYATGNHVAFGSAPDLHTAAHEAAHVVQQGAGVSLGGGGVGQVGDKYEGHADKVADKVVKGESAEGLLNQMTGGGPKGGTQKKKVQQLASDSVQMNPLPPANTNAGANANTSANPTPPDPEAQWRSYCDTLDAVAKPLALLITAADKREKFKAFQPTERTAYANTAMTATLRDEFLTLDATRTPVVVMQANATHLQLYASLASAPERETFRGLTPDERGDMTLVPQRAYVTQLLTDPNKLNEWRSWRVALALSEDRALAATLGVADPTNIQATANELLPVCRGQAGERMRRLINETGFENDADRVSSIQAVIADVKTGGKDPWASMEAQRPNWVLKGKRTSGDPEFAKVPLLKAMTHVSIAKFSNLAPGFLDELITANGQTPDAATRATFLASKADNVALAFPKWKAAGGVFNPTAHVTGAMVAGGRGRIGAYWMYDKGMAVVVDPATAGQDIMRMLAVEESPDYQLGFCIIELPNSQSTPATQDIRRPTMWDGLYFTQFAAIDDHTKCHGVTSGGSGEVVIEPLPLSSCTVKRNVYP